MGAWWFEVERFRPRSIATPNLLRSETDFKIIGYVLMPEHWSIFHPKGNRQSR